VTEFARRLPYRLLCTATAAPNDFIELGTSSEAVGELGYVDMLQKFFKAVNNTYAQGGRGLAGSARWTPNGGDGKFRFRGHGERDFWRWVCSWARAVRTPSDLGFDDGKFKLPKLLTREHVVTARTRREGMLFDLPAMDLHEQREERRRTINERCELIASLVNNTGKPAVVWCHLNDEGKALAALIPDAAEVSGDDAADAKEATFEAFAAGKIRVLVTKPTIAGFGLNWQHCAHETFFPSHSFEQWYQAVRRCWRFGQKKPVTIDVVASEGEAGVLTNLQRKADAADQMFKNLVALINDELRIEKPSDFTAEPTTPSWLSNPNT
jgi:hypothetical protein